MYTSKFSLVVFLGLRSVCWVWFFRVVVCVNILSLFLFIFHLSDFFSSPSSPKIYIAPLFLPFLLKLQVLHRVGQHS